MADPLNLRRPAHADPPTFQVRPSGGPGRVLNGNSTVAAIWLIGDDATFCLSTRYWPDPGDHRVSLVIHYRQQSRGYSLTAEFLTDAALLKPGPARRKLSAVREPG